MADFLDFLARDSKATCESGYYRADLSGRGKRHEKLSLKESVLKCTNDAIIAEIKRSSPSVGVMMKVADAKSFSSAAERGGAAGISVLTEPRHFGGSLCDLMLVRESASVPLLMKDIIVDRTQVDAASRIGADAVLLIQTVFERRYADCSLEDMIDYVHSKRMEVLLEVHTKEEFRTAIGLDVDLVGINNRDLRTLKVDLRTTEWILMEHEGLERVVVSESGIRSRADVLFLRSVGAKAFLVGTAIMLAGNVEMKVRELAGA